MRKRKIIGIQLHHSVILNDAVRFGANLCSALAGAVTCTGDPAFQELHDEAQNLLRRVSQAEQEASARLRSFQDRPDFKQIVEGDLPWPDETLAGFEARCRCYDGCLACDHGAAGAVCTCGNTCYRHPGAEGRRAE